MTKIEIRIILSTKLLKKKGISMLEDKTIAYHILKNLHYQNEFSHFIYRNTRRTTMNQKNANFWRIVELPVIFVAILEMGFIFITKDWVLGGWIISGTIGIGVLILYILHDIIVKKKNQREEENISFNGYLIFIQNSKEQVEFIEKYNIEGMDAIKSSKVEEIEDLINNNLANAFKRFRGQKIDKILNFLKNLSLTPSRLTGRLERLRNFMQKQLEDSENKDYFKRLNRMILCLQALEKKNLTRLNI